MNYYHYIMAFMTAFGVVLLATPSLIKVAKLKHLVDEPSEERKKHNSSVPTIGGIMIFSAFLFSCFLWFARSTWREKGNAFLAFYCFQDQL